MSVEEGVVAHAALADCLPDPVLIVDRDANVVWGNKAAERLFGRTLEDSVGLHALEFLHPDDLGVAALSMDSVRSKEVGTPLELRVKAVDGWHVVEAIGAPFGDDVLLTLRDLTERRRWEVAGSHLDRFRVILQNAAPPTLLVDEHGVVQSSSAALGRDLDIDQEWAEGLPLADLVREEDRDSVRAAITELVGRQNPTDIRAELDVSVDSPRGKRTTVSLVLANLLDDPTVEGVVATMHDVDRRVLAEREVQAANSLLEATLDATAEGVLAVDLGGRITSYNRRFLEMWQIPEGVVATGSDELSLEHAVESLVDPQAFIARVKELYADTEAVSSDVIEFTDGRVFERDSRPQTVDGDTIGRVWSFRDITATRRLQEKLTHQASHDSLTGLSNQRLFRELLSYALESTAERAGSAAVLFVDLDTFKTVNDSLGHLAGDEMLIHVAGRLQQCVRGRDTVARLGGDEFAILLDSLHREDVAEEVARRILNTLGDPIEVMGRQVAMTASIGIAYGKPGDTAEELLRNADLAMYVAKNDGRNRFRSYEPAMHHDALRRLEVESGLHGAALRGELVVHYQPIVEPSNRSVRAFEALVRWNHPEKGMLGPAEFIEQAEQSDLISEIGRHVLSVACEQAVAWSRSVGDSPAPSVTVNVSPRQLLDDFALVDHVAETLRRTRLDPTTLVLEITETALMKDPDLAAERLEELSNLGIRLALDDFGTGHSSLSHLRRFPIDTLKIDREFIEEVESPRGSSLVMAVAQLAHTLGMTVVAEGVETEVQRGILEALGCDLAQGFLFARPVPAEHATELLFSSEGNAGS